MGRQGHRSGSIVGRSALDPRPIGDKGYALHCARNVVDFLSKADYTKVPTHLELLREPSRKEFFDIFKFLISQLGVSIDPADSLESQVKLIMERFKYPVHVNKSKLQAISGPNTWPQLLAMLQWLVNYVEGSKCALACALGKSEDEAEEVGNIIDEMERVVPRFEAYESFLDGNDEEIYQEELERVYGERINAIQEEAERLENARLQQCQCMQWFEAERDKRIELHNLPELYERQTREKQHEFDAWTANTERLLKDIASQENEEQARKKDDAKIQEEIREASETVARQAFSKKDIERLKEQRSHYWKLATSARADFDNEEQACFELSLEEVSRKERIWRLQNGHSEVLAAQDDLGFKQHEIDLEEPTVALRALTFDEQHQQVRSGIATLFEAGQADESEYEKMDDEYHAISTSLAEKEETTRWARERFEQTKRMIAQKRHQKRLQIEEAQKCCVQLTDEVGQAAALIDNVGTQHITVTHNVEQRALDVKAYVAQSAWEKAEVEELCKRERETYLHVREFTLAQFSELEESVLELRRDIERQFDEMCEEDRRDGWTDVPPRRSNRSSVHKAARGGC